MFGALASRSTLLHPGFVPVDGPNPRGPRGVRESASGPVSLGFILALLACHATSIHRRREPRLPVATAPRERRRYIRRSTPRMQPVRPVPSRHPLRPAASVARPTTDHCAPENRRLKRLRKASWVSTTPGAQTRWRPSSKTTARRFALGRVGRHNASTQSAADRSKAWFSWLEPFDSPVSLARTRT